MFALLCVRCRISVLSLPSLIRTEQCTDARKSRAAQRMTRHAAVAASAKLEKEKTAYLSTCSILMRCTTLRSLISVLVQCAPVSLTKLYHMISKDTNRSPVLQLLR
jgi:hypothetical protein